MRNIRVSAGVSVPAIALPVDGKSIAEDIRAAFGAVAGGEAVMAGAYIAFACYGRYPPSLLS